MPALVLPLVLGTDDFGHMRGAWVFGLIVLGCVVFVSIVGLVLWAIDSSSRRPVDSSRSSNRARELLDERYAAGDVDRDEYLERKADLER